MYQNWIKILFAFIIPAGLSNILCSCQKVNTEETPVVLVITGNLTGAIQSCHCENGQPGGLDRRKAIFDNIQERYKNAVFIDCGNPVRKSFDNRKLQFQRELYALLRYNIVFHDSSDTGGDTTIVIGSNPGLMVYIVNIADTLLDDSDPTIDMELSEFSLTCSIVIVGGGGFLEPKVEAVDGKLFTYPGLFGSHVLVIKLWMGPRNGTVQKYDWEVIPTRDVSPDVGMKTLIDQFYSENYKVN